MRQPAVHRKVGETVAERPCSDRLGNDFVLEDALFERVFGIEDR
jgi:hypothetical protein